jgi:S1-C subfamily serine protease
MFKLRNIALILCALSVGCSTYYVSGKDEGPKYDIRSSFKSIIKIAMVIKSPDLGEGEVSGTAWAIDEDNIITAAHVCEAFNEFAGMGISQGVKVTRMTEDYKLVEAPANDIKILFSDSVNDMCLIRYEHHGLLPLKLAAKVEFGDKVYIVGAPLGFLGFILDGLVVNTQAELGGKYNNKLLVSAAATGGNSGGPIINEQGEVVGMLIAGAQPYDHFSIATRIQEIRKLIALLYI